jgi:hypothetical protein
MSENLLSFTCDASILKDAIESTSSNYIILLPNNDFLVLCNSKQKDDIPSYSIMSKECFTEFQLGNPNKTPGPSNTIDGFAIEDNEMAEDMPTFAIEVEDLALTLNKIKGEVSVTIVKQDDLTEVMYVKDANSKGSSHDGGLILEDEESLRSVLNVNIVKKRARFITYFESLAVPTMIVNYGPYIIVEIDENAHLNPILPKGIKDTTTLTLWETDLNEARLNIKSVNEMNNVFNSSFDFSIVVSELEESIEDKMEESRFKFKNDPKSVEQVLKKHKSKIEYIFISEIGDSDMPFIVLFGSTREYTKGSLHVLSVLPDIEFSDEEEYEDDNSSFDDFE